MKYIKIAVIILLLLNIASLVPVQALTYPRITKVEERLTVAPTKVAAREDTRLTTIKTTSDKMITDRIATLQQLLTHVTNDAHLSTADVTSFTNDINTNINSLQALKTKIDADTDVTTAQADRKSIVTSYRIYMIFDPKLRLMIAVDNLTATNQKLASLSANLTTLINNLQSQGKNVTALQTTLADMNAKLSDANTQLTNANTALKAITISQAGTQPFTTVKQNLANVRADYVAIRQDLTKIRSGVKAISPSSVPTISTSSAH